MQTRPGRSVMACSRSSFQRTDSVQAYSRVIGIGQGLASPQFDQRDRSFSQRCVRLPAAQQVSAFASQSDELVDVEDPGSSTIDIRCCAARSTFASGSAFRSLGYQGLQRVVHVGGRLSSATLRRPARRPRPPVPHRRASRTRAAEPANPRSTTGTSPITHLSGPSTATMHAPKTTDDADPPDVTRPPRR